MFSKDFTTCKYNAYKYNEFWWEKSQKENKHVMKCPKNQKCSLETLCLLLRSNFNVLFLSWVSNSKLGLVLGFNSYVLNKFKLHFSKSASVDTFSTIANHVHIFYFEINKFLFSAFFFNQFYQDIILFKLMFWAQLLSQSMFPN